MAPRAPRPRRARVSPGMTRRVARIMDARRTSPPANDTERIERLDADYVSCYQTAERYPEGLAVSRDLFRGIEGYFHEFIQFTDPADPRVAQFTAAWNRVLDYRARRPGANARSSPTANLRVDQRSGNRSSVPFRPNSFRSGPSHRVLADHDIRMTAAPPPSPESGPSSMSTSPSPSPLPAAANPAVLFLIILASLLEVLLRRVLQWVSLLQPLAVNVPVPGTDCASEAIGTPPSPKRDDDDDSNGAAGSVPSTSSDQAAVDPVQSTAAPSAPANSAPTTLSPPRNFKSEIQLAQLEITRILGEQSALYNNDTLDGRERFLRLGVQRDIAARKLRHLQDDFHAYRYTQRQLARSAASNSDAAEGM